MIINSSSQLPLSDYFMRKRVLLIFLLAFMAALIILNSIPTAADMHGSRISGNLVGHEENSYRNTYADYLEHREIFNSYISRFSETGCIDYKDLRQSMKPTSAVMDFSYNMTGGIGSELEIAYKLHWFAYRDIMYEETGSALNADDVLKHKTGDCTGKSILLAGMLEAHGIKSYVAEGYGHRYVFARIDGSWMPLDPTRDFYFAYRTWINGSSEAKSYYDSGNVAQFLFNSTATASNVDLCRG